VKVSIARALKMRNRLAGKIARLTDYIIRYATHPDDEGFYDVMYMLKERQILVEDLVELKTMLDEACLDLRWKIYSLSEMKATIALLRELEPSGSSPRDIFSRDDERVNYVREVDFDWIKDEIEGLEAEIDDIQEDIDKFNAQNFVEVKEKFGHSSAALE